MCYPIHGKNNILCHDKIHYLLLIWFCRHVCYDNVINAWCCLCYVYNFELFWHRPRHVCWRVISSFARPFSWHSPLTTSQSHAHSIITSVSGFQSIHYQYIQKVDIYFCVPIFLQTNENICLLSSLDFGKVCVNQQLLALPPYLLYILLWIFWLLWNVQFS